jgi:citrate lyase subunit beta/citryl-CoA lyase
VALAARLRDVPAIDQTVLEIRDPARFEADAGEGRALGYAGKLCVHPSQVPIANRAFGPSTADLAWAARVVAAWDADGRGAAEVDGRMIDEPIARRARALLETQPETKETRP